MARQSVRWGRACRALVIVGVGVVASPALLSTTAFAADAPKGTIKVQKDVWGDTRADAVSKDYSGRYDAARDPGSLFNVTTAIGAREVWKQTDASGRSITGRGVTVALLDSGLAPVSGLDGADKVVQGPDLSLEAGSEGLRGLDTFGHGTHLGAIIGGADPVDRDSKTGAPKPKETGQLLGVAPDAGLLSLKLATANGSTDVSQVIAGLDWISQHAEDQGMNVRVVNLAFGTDSLQPYQLDPLAAAAENAWHHGIVVVVSGGNEGQDAGRLTDPAMDPYVIAVGAADPQLRVDGWKSPVVADFSNSGSEQRHVDLIAPGKSITSLRDPGSFVDVHHPEGLVEGDETGRLFRGSGTSQAAAVVSGAAALMLQANPTLTPDQVKAALIATARPVKDISPLLQGAGELDVQAAVKVSRPPASGAVPAAMQRYAVASGAGSLEAARGGSNLVGPSGEVLAGELDVQGNPFDSARWSTASAAGASWSGGTWNGARWSGDGWDSARWSDAAWLSARWSSARWSSARWSAAGWEAANWDSARWSSARWSDASWASSDWDSARWSSARWSSARWSSARWS